MAHHHALHADVMLLGGQGGSRRASSSGLGRGQTQAVVAAAPITTTQLYHQPSATVLVMELVGWEQLTAPAAESFGQAAPAAEVALALNSLYSAFDSVLRRQRANAAPGLACEKIKVEGARYVAAVGASALEHGNGLSALGLEGAAAKAMCAVRGCV